MEKAGMINVYQCPHGHKTVTVNRDAGTTSFVIKCRHDDCKEMARSAFYQVEQTTLPEYEWYKPTSLTGLNYAERNHVSQGGLLLRKIK